MKPCDFWSDGLHCFMEKHETDAGGFYEFGSAPVKACRCGEVVRASQSAVTPSEATT